MEVGVEAEIGDATPPAKAGAGRIVIGFVFALISAVMLFLMWNYTANLWLFCLMVNRTLMSHDIPDTS